MPKSNSVEPVGPDEKQKEIEGRAPRTVGIFCFRKTYILMVEEPWFEDEEKSGKLCSRECSNGNRKFSSLVVGIMIAVGLCAFIGIGKFKFTGSLE